MSQQNMTQTEFAKKLGVTQAAVSKWMNGTPPGADVVVRIARIFSVSTDFLLMGDSRQIAGNIYRNDVEEAVDLDKQSAHWRKLVEKKIRGMTPTETKALLGAITTLLQ